jgi:hypothetical protein
MSNRVELLTPVGRLVQGSLYDPQTTDAENKPLIYKTGPNAGQPRQEFYFAIAIPKGIETHWSTTEWGLKIYNCAQQGFPNGQANAPSFAWKIKDGDSNIPNRVGRKPSDCEGFPGHWILNFSSGFAPAIYTADGSSQINEANAVNLGDYIQVYGSVADNESLQQPGVYLNHSMVAFAGYGKRIFTGADPKMVGFGNAPLPAGVSATPLAQGFNPAPVTPPMGAGVYNPPQPSWPGNAQAPTPSPHHAILNPPPVPVPAPAPVAPARVMLPAANGASYEQCIAAGWTDALLIQHGMMQ